jgi:peptidoglycan/xylan/chitin deacetylase (PgdA/CDA1 family)
VLRKLFAAMAIVVILLCAVMFWSYSDAVVSVPLDEKVVALTYDDGPNPPHTQALLEMLAQHGVTATFFLKGRNVEAFPESVQAVAQAGHEIGNHSYSHRPMLSLSQSAMREELVRTSDLIENLLGQRPVLFRPPYGLQGPGLKMALDELGMPSILMSSNGTDWEETDPELIANKILESIAPGDIILLHDGHGDVDEPAAQQSRAPSVAATGIVIEELKARGYRFVTVSELIALDAFLPIRLGITARGQTRSE